LVRKNKRSEKKEKKMKKFLIKILSTIVKIKLTTKYLCKEKRQGVDVTIWDVIIAVSIFSHEVGSITFETDRELIVMTRNIDVVAGLASNTGLQHHFIGKVPGK
jgi:hypothetical protein